MRVTYLPAEPPQQPVDPTVLYPIQRDQNYDIVISLWVHIHPSLIMFSRTSSYFVGQSDVLHEVLRLAEGTRANFLEMGVLWHQQVYERQIDVIMRFCHRVNFLGDDATLVPCNPSSSSSSASTAHSHQVSSSSTRPPYSITLSAPTMYMTWSSGLYTLDTSSYVHSSLHDMLCCYVLISDTNLTERPLIPTGPGPSSWAGPSPTYTLPPSPFRQPVFQQHPLGVSTP
jgi:hypothetical protein